MVEIKLQNVTKYYQDGDKSTKGIEDVSLTLKTDGSFVVITGESGAGKSTLIRILTGLEDFDEGEILFDDVPLSGMSDSERHELYSKNISFVFQDYNLVESFTAKENIKLALIRSGLDLKEADKKAVKVLKQVGLSKQMNMRTSKLSGGERQRVAIARSMALETKVIIFDEPTGNLDQNTSKEIISLIQSLAKNSLVIYVTHELYQVKDVMTRHIILKDGSLLSDNIVKPVEDSSVQEVEPKSRKYSLKGRLYSSSLFAFRRPGRFFATCLILILTAFSCFSTALVCVFSFGGLSGIFGISYTGNGIGNEVTVRKKNSAAENVPVPEDSFRDDFDFFSDTYLYAYLEEDLKTYQKNNDYIFDNPLPTNIKWMPYPSMSYTEDERNGQQKENSVYFVLPSEFKKNNSYQIQQMIPYIGKTVEIIPGGLYSYGYHDSDDTADTVDLLNVFPKFVFSGICYSSELKWNQTYVTSFNADCLAKQYEAMKTGYYTLNKKQNINWNYNVRVPMVSVALKNEESTGFNVEIYDNDNYNKENGLSENAFFFDPYWKDKEDEVLVKLNGFTVPLSSLKNRKYREKHEPTYTYIVEVTSGAILSESIDMGCFARYYFKDKGKISSFTKSISSEDYEVKEIPPFTLIPPKMVPFAQKDVISRISAMFNFIILIFILFQILKLMRRILSNFYYRKSNDQMVLGYIGYTFKDMLLINIVQFMTITVLSNFIVYPVMLSISLVNGYFQQLPSLFIFSTILDLIFSVYLSLPNARRRKRK